MGERRRGERRGRREIKERGPRLSKVKVEVEVGSDSFLVKRSDQDSVSGVDLTKLDLGEGRLCAKCRRLGTNFGLLSKKQTKKKQIGIQNMSVSALSVHGKGSKNAKNKIGKNSQQKHTMKIAL
jgi:hypothetical protein